MWLIMLLNVKLLNTYETQYNKLPEDQKKMINVINEPGMLSLDLIEDDLASLSAVEGDEEIKLEPEETIDERERLNPRKTGTELKFLTPNNLLTRLPILLAQIKAGNNSKNLKIK